MHTANFTCIKKSACYYGEHTKLDTAYLRASEIHYIVKLNSVPLMLFALVVHVTFQTDGSSMSFLKFGLCFCFLPLYLLILPLLLPQPLLRVSQLGVRGDLISSSVGWQESTQGNEGIETVNDDITKRGKAWVKGARYSNQRFCWQI
jgi:hypothetical protein